MWIYGSWAAVNLSRELRRFEPFSRHTWEIGPVTSNNGHRADLVLSGCVRPGMAMIGCLWGIRGHDPHRSEDRVQDQTVTSQAPVRTGPGGPNFAVYLT